jgi:hypothetical protein
MVFAGGGFRFGVYLGLYAAMCEAKREPDVILATCGGTVAASIIQGLPDDAQRKAWLSSEPMYRFWCQLRSPAHTTFTGTLVQALQRRMCLARATHVPDVFGTYLFDMPAVMPLPMPLKKADVDVVSLGGKLLFGPHDVGQLRGQRKLFESTIFGPPRAAEILHGMALPFANSKWGEHTLAETMVMNTQMPLNTVARLGITDFYYFPCYAHGPDHYIGGVVDLLPIELAQRLADEVMIETKSLFDSFFSIPAWRAVLGLDGNQRIRHVNAQPVALRFDTIDAPEVLHHQQVRRQVDWRRNRISLKLPMDHATYVQHMNAQWEYGYERGLMALQ